MSGPKLVGITCDPVIIRSNEERLRAIGKVKYYSELFKDLNIDMKNAIQWIEDYGQDSINQHVSIVTVANGLLDEVNNLKEEFREMVQSNFLDNSRIEAMEVAELRKLCLDRTDAIPEWKQSFIRRVTKLLQELQKKIELEESKSRERFRRNADELRKWQQAQDRNIKHRAKAERREEIGNIALSVPKKKQEKEIREYGLDELAVIENMTKEIVLYKQKAGLSIGEKKLVAEIEQILKYIDINDERYGMDGKRGLLASSQMKFQMLRKSVAKSRFERQEREKERNTLLLEYRTFTEALAMPDKADHFTFEELHDEVERLRHKVAMQEERVYLEASMTKIMEKYGYEGVSSVSLHEYEHTSRILFENSESHKLNVSFGKGKVMIQVVGEGNGKPTREEVNEQVRQQGALCEIYPEIKAELEKRNIHIDDENLAPASPESAVNISYERKKSLENDKGRRSLFIPSSVFAKIDRSEQEQRGSYDTKPRYMSAN